MPKSKNDGEDLLNDFLADIPKFITLNQVNVKIAGGTDKLLVVRDVTSIVMNEQIMETKKDMAKFTDTLMKEVQEHAKVTKEKLESVNQFVQDQGKEIIEETFCELKKMQLRISDFQQVYNVSENKFQPIFEKVHVKKCIDEIVALVKQDLKGRYMDINLVIDKDVPETIISDSNSMKLVILNLFNQSVIGQARGFVKINVSYKETGLGVSEPCIAVTLENSKFVIKPKDAQRLNRMSQESQFAKIIEAKCEVNYKISKILTNALNWNIDFNAFKSAKQTIFIPIKAGFNVDLPQVEEQAPPIVKDKKPKRNEQDLFNEIEGQRRDV